MNHIQKLVKDDRLLKALTMLLNQNNDEAIKNEIVSLSGRLTNLDRDNALGLISKENAIIERNKIRKSVLFYGLKYSYTDTIENINLPSNFVGLGNEPGWSLRLEGNKIIFVSDYGNLIHVYSIDSKFESDNIWHYRSITPFTNERLFISVTITKEKWNDDMSGHEYPYRVEITENFRHFIGVGEVINKI